MDYFYIFLWEILGYGHYLFSLVLNPSWTNILYWLIAISLFFWMLEVTIPWRENQGAIRKDFKLDVFYMFFNFFIFNLIGYAGLSKIGTTLFKDLLLQFGIENLVAKEIESMDKLILIPILFVVKDFVQYFVHRLLHQYQKLWNFHKVHHSVLEMGFAAHLRYHWMETIVYKTILYIPMAMMGIDLVDYFYADLIAITIGHFNHSNIKIPLGPFKYILNNPQMHIWHHAKEIPNEKGVNFGVSLSIWDYLFGTDYIPKDGRDIALGFDKVEDYPSDFWEQMSDPFHDEVKNEKSMIK